MLVGLQPNDVGDYVIYCFNEVVASFGGKVESELSKIEGKNSAEVEMKQRSVLKKYLGENPQTAPGQFADPALMFK